MDTSFYNGRPLADRARKVDTREIVRLLDDHNIQYDEANGRDALVAVATPFATIRYDIAHTRAATDVDEAALTARGVGVQALQADIDATPKRGSQPRQYWRNHTALASAPTPDTPGTTPPNHDGQAQLTASQNPFVPPPPPPRDNTAGLPAYQLPAAQLPSPDPAATPRHIPPLATPEGIQPDVVMEVDAGGGTEVPFSQG